MNDVTEQSIEICVSDPQADVLNARTPLILDMAGQGAGKTELIGLSSGFFVLQFPELKGFIAANTYMQLNQSTLNKTFSSWKKYFNLTEFDKRNNPLGDFVIDKQPPPHFKRFEKFKNYNGIISFNNGALIFVGSLDNYKAHDGKEFAWAHLDETKDTKKEALTMVILARLRQFGLWVGEDGKALFTLDGSDAEKKGYKSWNPCYIHTSPAEGSVDWLIDMFALSKKEEDIRKTLTDTSNYFFTKDEERTSVIYQTHWNEDNLPPGYIKSRMSQLSENEQLKFIFGYPFSKTGGEFYPNFNRRTHVVHNIEYNVDGAAHLTYDFNVMPYMTQILAQVEYVTKWINRETGLKYAEYTEGRDLEQIEVMQIRFIREYCLKSPQNTTEHVAQAFIDDLADDYLPDVFVYGDASGRNRITGLGSLTQYKIIEGKLSQYLPNNWMRVPKANVARLKRRDLVNRILEGKIPEIEILIDASCTELIRDMEYVKLGTDGKVKEKAKDPNSGISYEKLGHCFVGSTMITTIDGEKRIDQIKVGDMVLTRFGFKKVLNTFYNGIRKVKNYHIAGKKITCTPDHKVFTFNRGFVRALELMQSDTFCIFDGKKIKSWQEKPQKTANYRLSMDLISEDTQMQQDCPIGCISKDGLKSMVSQSKYQHIDMFGLSIMAAYRKECKSTIRTKTRQTTLLKIWNFLQGKSITKSTFQQKKGKKPLEKYLGKKQYQNQKNGIKAKRVESGTNSTQKNHSLLIQKQLNVQNVETSLKAFTYQTQDIAQTHVKSNTVIINGSSKQKVYDIEVEGRHEYFANGILVHNCSDALEYLVCELCKQYLKEF